MTQLKLDGIAKNIKDNSAISELAKVIVIRTEKILDLKKELKKLDKVKAELESDTTFNGDYNEDIMQKIGIKDAIVWIEDEKDKIMEKINRLELQNIHEEIDLGELTVHWKKDNAQHHKDD